MIMTEATARKLDFGLMNETRRIPNLTWEMTMHLWKQR